MALTKITSDGITDGTVVNADINASAAIAKSKIETFVNNNADNRVITGSGTANTLNGESALTFDGARLHINSGNSGLPKLRLQHSGAGNDVFEITSGLIGVTNSGFGIYDVDASAYRLAIDSSGKIGIGTTSPSQKLTVAYSNGTAWSTSNLGVGMKVENTNAVNGVASGIELRSFQNNGGASIQYIHAVNDGVSSYGSDLVFSTRVAYTGAYRESCRITNAGNLKFPNGHGIDFSATSNGTNATSVNETLNDYEEGTWTPTTPSGGGGWNSVSSAMYRKVGKIVFLTFYGGLASQTSTNALKVGGFPYAAAGGNHYSYLYGRVEGYASSDAVWQVTTGSSEATLFFNNNVVGYNNFSANAYVLISGFYFTDS